VRNRQVIFMTLKHAAPIGRPSFDSELVARAMAGDLVAHESLFRRHAPDAWELALVCYRRPAAAEVAVRLGFGMALVAAHSDPLFAKVPFGVTVRHKVRAVAPRVAKAASANDDDLTAWSRAVRGPSAPLNRLIEVFETLSEPARAALWVTEVQALGLVDAAAVLNLPLPDAAMLLEQARADLSRRILRVPRGERPPDPRVALMEMVVPMPRELTRRATDDWRKWLAHSRRAAAANRSR
jgi:hypothetical protein